MVMTNMPYQGMFQGMNPNLAMLLQSYGGMSPMMNQMGLMSLMQGLPQQPQSPFQFDPIAKWERGKAPEAWKAKTFGVGYGGPTMYDYLSPQGRMSTTQLGPQHAMFADYLSGRQKPWYFYSPAQRIFGAGWKGMHRNQPNVMTADERRKQSEWDIR